MNKTSREIRCRVCFADPSEWDELVERFPDRTVFHTLAWLRALEQANKLALILLKALQGDTCVAVWPCLEQRKGPFRILGSPLQGWSTPYLGPLFKAEADIPAALRAFLALPVFRRAAYCHCKVVDAGRTVDLSTAGFERISTYRTYLVDLKRPEEDLWRALEKRCKEAVRKGRRAGLVVNRLEGQAFVDDFWRMLLAALARRGLKPAYDRRMIECAVENLGRDKRLLVMSASVDDRPSAMLIAAHDGQTLHPIASATAVRCRHQSPGNILWWETILEARRLGLSCFDMSSTFGGPGKFRRSFGPVECAMATHWERSRSPLVALCKRGYENWARRKLRVAVPADEQHG